MNNNIGLISLFIRMRLIMILTTQKLIGINRLLTLLISNNCKLIFHRTSLILIDYEQAMVIKVVIKSRNHLNISHHPNSLKKSTSWESKSVIFFSGPFMGYPISPIVFHKNIGSLIQKLYAFLYYPTISNLKSEWNFYYNFDDYLIYIYQNLPVIDYKFSLQNVVFSIIHGDFKLTNLVTDGNDIHLIDWEFSTLGPICTDLLKGFLDLYRTSHNITINKISEEIIGHSKKIIQSHSKIDNETVYNNLFAALIHLIANEFLMGHLHPFNTNFKDLIGIMRSVSENLSYSNK